MAGHIRRARKDLKDETITLETARARALVNINLALGIVNALIVKQVNESKKVKNISGIENEEINKILTEEGSSE